MNLSQAEMVIPLPRPVDSTLASDIEKESVFVSPFLERIVVEPDRASVRAILKNNAPMEEVRDKATRYLETMAKQVSGYNTKVFLENKRNDDGEYEANANLSLAEAGWLHDYGKGQVAYSGPVLKLARLINEKAGALYAERLGAIDGHFPALVDADTLQKCGYFDSHPNAVTFIGNMLEDFDAIEEFRVANSCSEGALLPPQEHVHVDGMCLNPAACFPCYPTLTGRKLDEGECYSWLGRVFRYESRNISGLERLYEFNVRELVYVGSEAFTRVSREKSLIAIEDLIRFFDLDAVVQTATDPFFATVSAARKFWQQAQEVKSEILMPVAQDDGSRKLLACGSINLHGNFFGTRFEILCPDGEPANTGCVGLGIERWVLACFSQHGLDPDRWPAGVRDRIF
jgi:seryl-tRNA synthetase